MLFGSNSAARLRSAALTFLLARKMSGDAVHVNGPKQTAKLRVTDVTPGQLRRDAASKLTQRRLALARLAAEPAEEESPNKTKADAKEQAKRTNALNLEPTFPKLGRVEEIFQQGSKGRGKGREETRKRKDSEHFAAFERLQFTREFLAPLPEDFPSDETADSRSEGEAVKDNKQHVPRSNFLSCMPCLPFRSCCLGRPLAR